MVPSLLFDLGGVDLDAVQFDVQEIERTNPHRGDMRLLDGVTFAADDFLCAIAYKNIRDDEFWVAGHIPGRPLFPGVLMIEAAAQLASFMTIRKWPKLRFLGFTRVNKVSFRGQVVPGDKLYILAKAVNFRPRRFICAAQGMVNGSLVFEAQVVGMPI